MDDSFQGTPADRHIPGHTSFLRRTCISFSALQSKFSWVFSKSCLILSHSTIVFRQFPNIRNGPYLWIFRVIIVQEQSEFNYFHTSWLLIFNWSNLHISHRPLHDQDQTWQCGQCHLDPAFHWASLLAPGHHDKVDASLVLATPSLGILVSPHSHRVILPNHASNAESLSEGSLHLGKAWRSNDLEDQWSSTQHMLTYKSY